MRRCGGFAFGERGTGKAPAEMSDVGQQQLVKDLQKKNGFQDNTWS